jgi:PiT family inorganic phosphate transporter
MLILLLLATCFLAYANGANDNFKGVASLFGSRTTSYRTAVAWATLTTFAGSICSIFLAQSLLKKFSGKGLVPDAVIASNDFLLAIAIAAGATVILATVFGFPISTTHGLIGAMIGAGLTAVGPQVNFSALGKAFFFPLILSPLLAIAIAAALYVILHIARLKLGVSKEMCVCIGEKTQVYAMPQPASAFMFKTMPMPQIELGCDAECSQRYAGNYLGLNAQAAMDFFHFLSGGVVCFARALNDTPKIAAMLLVVTALNIRSGMIILAVTMAIGGLLHSRKIAETMGKKITAMNHGQGFSANLTTGILVILASKFGLPVSTTHVSCGALFGIGLTTREANVKTMLGIALSWLITLPCAALIAATAYAALKHI